MSGRQQQFSGTMAVRPQHRFDEAAFADYLMVHLPDVAPPLFVRQFRGGQSNPTYLLSDSAGHAWVLRRKPPGKLLKSAHAIEREYRVISALHEEASVPVARPRLLCEDPDVIGTPFYVMDHVEGRIFWEAAVPGVAKAERAAIYDAMNATIAALHRLDPTALGLDDFGRPGNYFARQIARWSKQYAQEVEIAGRVKAMERLIDWLPAHIPPDDASAIVHGDFRIDNLIFAADAPRVVAVLDWELSTLGHPLADFAYHLMMYRMPPTGFTGLAGADLEALGIPSEGAYMRRYCERTGRDPLPREELDFYIAFNMFRLAGILHGILGRVKRGTASNPHAAAQGAMCAPLAELAWQQVAHLAG
ncbi:MAG: phosphotransferase family protein [Alphaproteobacteria bacterium]|nr:MAG: phosphotransferase family protein [Alphaproteobacteria bacterium]